MTAETVEMQKDFAKRVGLTPARISQLAREGLPTRNKKVLVEPALEWMAANMCPQRVNAQRRFHGSRPRPTPAGTATNAPPEMPPEPADPPPPTARSGKRRGRPPRAASPPPAPADPPAGDDDDTSDTSDGADAGTVGTAPDPSAPPGLSFAEARRMREIVRLHKEKAEFDRLKGRLADWDLVNAELEAWARRERDALLAWTERVVPALAAELRVDGAALAPALRRAVEDHIREVTMENPAHVGVVRRTA